VPVSGRLALEDALPEDAEELARLRCAAADSLTEQYGRGHWSHAATERGVARAIKTSRVLVARRGRRIVATLRLATAKPWAIDPRYFRAVERPLYLHDLAVDPSQQGRGVGRRLVERAVSLAAAWPRDAIRLDAYDAPAGAGGFYARCGFREVGRVTYRETRLIYFERLL
jgi:GNAT superfamily N-acetyltransferase